MNRLKPASILALQSDEMKETGHYWFHLYTDKN